MDIIQQTLAFLEEGKNRTYASSLLKISVEIKKDHLGFIVDPLDTNLKCGWGYDLTEAVYHCAQRNNIEL